MPFRFARHAGLAIAPALLLALSMLVSVSVSISVQAHSPMTSVTPADGARLTSAPATIEMRFRDPSRLIRFGLAAAEDGTDVALGDDHLMVEATDHTVSLPPLGAGSYVASWRAMGEDGHVIKGRFSFTIAPE
jgi:methionine-rich copper-binding protein CopC